MSLLNYLSSLARLNQTLAYGKNESLRISVDQMPLGAPTFSFYLVVNDLESTSENAGLDD